MGDASPPSPVLLLLAAFSRHAEALDWAREHAKRHWGPVALASEVFDFAETDYYAPSMGPDLKKVFLVFQQLVDPGRLAAIKTLTNAWESEYATGGRHAEPRPLNLDPGYLTEAKLVLASTKDHAHRIYLAEGIFAEVTLSYRDRRWQSQAWTFADYRRADYHAFFSRCRDYLRACRRAGHDGGV